MAERLLITQTFSSDPIDIENERSLVSEMKRLPNLRGLLLLMKSMFMIFWSNEVSPRNSINPDIFHGGVEILVH